MSQVRLNGLKLLAIGLVVTGVIIAIANYAFGEGNWFFIGYGFAIPGAMGLVGLIQLVGGVPFGELATKWGSLAAWQRGILGTLLVLVAGVVIMGCMILFAQIMYE